MTVKIIINPKRYQGLSTDEKPIDPVPPEGSTFYAIDTGEEYIFYNGTWERDLRLITAIRAV